MILALVLIGLILLVIIMIAGSYNSLVNLRNRVKNAWSQVDVQLKRRHDLIPNLIETAKGYMEHEKAILGDITKLRAQAINARQLPEKIAAEESLGRALGQFYAVVENYPELKANQNFLALQEELTSTENRIAFARQAYNDQVLFLNNKIQMFPSNIIAAMFNFKEELFYEVTEAEREVPKVSFS
ncbi:MAG: LemA family protein [Bacillota bacterium]|jgi:LemA protein